MISLRNCSGVASWRRFEDVYGSGQARECAAPEYEPDFVALRDICVNGSGRAKECSPPDCEPDFIAFRDSSTFKRDVRLSPGMFTLPVRKIVPFSSLHSPIGMLRTPVCKGFCTFERALSVACFGTDFCGRWVQ